MRILMSVSLALASLMAISAQADFSTRAVLNAVKFEQKETCQSVTPTSPCVKMTQTFASFTVPSGGPCHTYTSRVSKVETNNVVIIVDNAIPNCTRPELDNFSASIEIKLAMPDAQIILDNPMSVRKLR